MKPLFLILLHLVLVAGGYFMGTRILGNSPPAAEPSPTRANVSSESPELATSDDGILRDPRTGATFTEARQQLEKLADQAAPPWLDSHQLLEGQRKESSRLEIDRTFALATQEEMLAFFAEEDLSALDGHILSAAYGRLATLSPESATAVWSERSQREEESTGVDGLVRAWALQDLDAAEEWVDALPKSGRVRDQALIALLETSLDLDPAVARRRFTEVDELYSASNLTSRIAWTLDNADFPAFTERILSVTQGKWEHQNQLAAALEVWAERDSESALAWLKQQPTARIKENAISQMGGKLLKNGDPASIARVLGSSADENQDFAQLAGQAWIAWLSSGEDDKGALDWLQAHGKDLEFSRDLHWVVSHAWTVERAEDILPQLSVIPDDTTRNALVRQILQGLARSNPKAALEQSGKLLNTGYQDLGLITSSIYRLARQDKPGPTLEWILEKLPSGETRIQSVQYLMNIWAQSDPRAAADRARSLPEALRKEAFSGLSYPWANIAPDQVFDYLRSASDPSAVQELAKSAMWQVGHNQGSQATLDQALALPDAEMRAEAVPAFIDGWARANLEDSAAALNQLEKGPIRDASIEEFVGTAARSDRESALTWSLAIGAPGKRRKVTMRQARQWLRADKEKAKRWIETADALPEEWKEQLLGQE